MNDLPCPISSSYKALNPCKVLKKPFFQNFLVFGKGGGGRREWEGVVGCWGGGVEGQVDQPGYEQTLRISDQGLCPSSYNEGRDSAP